MFTDAHPTEYSGGTRRITITRVY